MWTKFERFSSRPLPHRRSQSGRTVFGVRIRSSSGASRKKKAEGNLVQRVIFEVLPTNYYLSIANNSCYILLKRHKQWVGSFQKLRSHLGWEILEIRQFFL